jgi:hypothetical protein
MAAGAVEQAAPVGTTKRRSFGRRGFEQRHDNVAVGPQGSLRSGTHQLERTPPMESSGCCSTAQEPAYFIFESHTDGPKRIFEARFHLEHRVRGHKGMISDLAPRGHRHFACCGCGILGVALQSGCGPGRSRTMPRSGESARLTYAAAWDVIAAMVGSSTFHHETEFFERAPLGQTR